MVFDVTGAAADVPVERLADGVLEFVTGHRFSRQPLQQDLGFVEEAGGAVAALEREVIDEGFLERGQLAVLGVAFDGPDRLAVKT